MQQGMKRFGVWFLGGCKHQRKLAGIRSIGYSFISRLKLQKAKIPQSLAIMHITSISSSQTLRTPQSVPQEVLSKIPRINHVVPHFLLCFSSSMIFTTSTMRAQNSTCEIFPSPFASSSLRMSLMSSQVGASTLKASVSLRRSWPSSCRSMLPELSVSKEWKAFLSSRLARSKISSKLILLQEWMEVVHKNQKLKSFRLRGITRLERRTRFSLPGCYSHSSQATLCSIPPQLASLTGCIDILADALSLVLAAGYSFLRQLLNFTTSFQCSGLVLRSLMKRPRNLLAQLLESLFMSLAFIYSLISFLLPLRPWRRLFLLEDCEELSRWDSLDCERRDLICLVDSYDLLRSELEQKLF